jgi:tetratricopeptide (TPR) repeat protein
MKMYDEAILLYQKVLTLDPKDVDSLCNLGIALMRSDRISEAIDMFWEVLTIQPHDPVATEYFAFLQKSLREAEQFGG